MDYHGLTSARESNELGLTLQMLPLRRPWQDYLLSLVHAVFPVCRARTICSVGTPCAASRVHYTRRGNQNADAEMLRNWGKETEIFP